MSKKTLVVGASLKPGRYANMAIELLNQYGHEVVAYGKDKGKVGDIDIQTEWPEGELFDTVTLYVAPSNQEELMPKVLALNPRRIIFNPGTENSVFEQLAHQAGIGVDEACTLVMLRTNQY